MFVLTPGQTKLVYWLISLELCYAVCDFLSDLTPNPFPTREWEQESKPLDLSGRGMEAGFQEEVAHRVMLNSFSDV
ncbi:MAG: hypothetical protein MET45_13590 [Nostoc sp. LLA-1]|nr:hypothetical protein [Cyanocohniella sp. LLY]